MNKFFTVVLSALFVSLSAHAEIEWKSVFISGDHSIPNFDNGRKALSELLAPLGAHQENQVHLSSTDRELSADVALASGPNIVKAFTGLNVSRENGGCLVFMTSHGSKNQGFYLSRAGILSPATLGKLLESACGELPTVVLISACYSGQFIAPALTGKNRIILTAARNDRPSFGCSTDTVYTYWDECLLESFPVSDTWKDLYQAASACISRKESAGGFQPSHPQAFFGDEVKELRILNK